MADKEIEVFETTAGQVTDVLKRLGVPKERMITVMIESDDWLTKGSRAACWMRLVVDTNVFVSAALKENSLPFLVARWIDRHDGLLKSMMRAVA